MKKDNLKQFYKEFPSNPEVRVKALKSILEKKGLIDQKALDEILAVSYTHLTLPTILLV